MAAFKFFDGNLGFYGYDKLANYVVTGRTDTVTTLDWNTGLGALDPTRFAAHISLTYSGYASYVIEDGPDAGETRVIGGTLTGVTFSDAGGNTLLDVTKLAVRLPVLMNALEHGDSYGAWQMLTQAGSTFTGANSAAGAGHAGTGDFIATTTGNDNVQASGGDDFVKDGGGADTYSGGSGFDTLAYDGWNFTPWLAKQGIVVDQLRGTVTGPDGQVDTISGFEDISGTFLGDTMKGSAGSNQFEGGSGGDTIDGRGGRDTVSYARDASWGGTDGIRANLANGNVRDGFGYVDRLLNVESIIGTAVRDTFLDNAGDNAFDGQGGNDTMHFTVGNDYGRGGLGADTFIFDGVFSDDTIGDFNAGDGDKIQISAATAFSQLQLFNITADSGPAVLVVFGASTITLEHLQMSDLHVSDFVF